jgi:Tfp pilus assembly protein FimT
MTSIELMVVAGILAALVAVAMPNIPQILLAFERRGAAQEIYQRLQSARMKAVKENNRVRLLRLNTTEYQVHDDEDSDGVVDNDETVTTYDISQEHPNARIGPSGVVIVFAPNGRATTTGTLVVAVGGAYRRVQVVGGGQIRIL